MASLKSEVEQMNPLYNEMQQHAPAGNILQRFQQFQQSFHGDARQQVQQLLQSGRISQEQYNRAVQMAQQLQGMLPR